MSCIRTRKAPHADHGPVTSTLRQRFAEDEHVSQVAPAVVSIDGSTAFLAVQYDVP